MGTLCFYYKSSKMSPHIWSESPLLQYVIHLTVQDILWLGKKTTTTKQCINIHPLDQYLVFQPLAEISGANLLLYVSRAVTSCISGHQTTRASWFWSRYADITVIWWNCLCILQLLVVPLVDIYVTKLDN